MPNIIIHDDVLHVANSRVGMVLRGKYRLDRVLGVGGMACVYAASHRNGSKVAIKLLHPELSVSADVRSRFLREGYVANAIMHPGVVRIIDDDEDPLAGVFLVMELLDGENFTQLADRSGGCLATPIVLSKAHALLDILVVAHARSILHRDIKPENVFVCRDGEVKLIDFGVARMREAASYATRTGVAFGTPAFMSPEQALGDIDATDTRSDTFSVGAVMFRLLSGRCIHEGETATELLVASATKQAPPLRDVAPSTPPSAAYVVDRALRFDKEQRWPSVMAFRDAIRAAHVTICGEQLVTASRLSVPPIAEGRSAHAAPRSVQLLTGGDIIPDEQDAQNDSSDVSTTVALRPSHAGPAPTELSTVTPSPSSVAGLDTNKSPERRNVGWLFGLLASAGAAARLVIGFFRPQTIDGDPPVPEADHNQRNDGFETYPEGVSRRSGRRI